MPHIASYKIDGVKVPSVTTVTGVVPKPWLVNWYRKYGFEYCDATTKTATDRGKKHHAELEAWLRTGGPLNADETNPYIVCLAAWMRTNNVSYDQEDIERHMESKLYMYHGSPDWVVKLPGGYAMVDFKFRPSMHYDILLNEAAYSQMYFEETGRRINEIIILRFDTETMTMGVPYRTENKPEYLDEFLLCRKMYDLWKKAEKIDRKAWDEKD